MYAPCSETAFKVIFIWAKYVGNTRQCDLLITVGEEGGGIKGDCPRFRGRSTENLHPLMSFGVVTLSTNC